MFDNKIFKNLNGKTTYEKVVITKEEKIPPKVLIDVKALRKMKAYVKNYNKEIGWLAYCNKDKNGVYIIYDTVLLEQDVTSVKTDIRESAIAKLGEELLMTDLTKFNDLRVWGHSHVDMEVNPSGTDEETFEQFYENCEYFIRIIANKRGDLRLDIVDCENEIRFNNVKWSTVCLDKEENDVYDKISKLFEQYDELSDKLKEFEDKFNEEELPLIKKDIKDKVKEFSHTSNYTTTGGKNVSYYKQYGDYDYSGYNGENYYSDTYYKKNENEEDLKKKERKKEKEKEEEDEDFIDYTEMYEIFVYNDKGIGKLVPISCVLDNETLMYMADKIISGDWDDTNLYQFLYNDESFRLYDEKDWYELYCTLELWATYVAYGK